MLSWRPISGCPALKPSLSHVRLWARGAPGRRWRRVSRRRAVWRNRGAAAAVEYAIIAGVLATIVMSASGPFFSGLAALLTHVSDGL